MLLLCSAFAVLCSAFTVLWRCEAGSVVLLSVHCVDVVSWWLLCTVVLLQSVVCVV